MQHYGNRVKSPSRISPIFESEYHGRGTMATVKEAPPSAAKVTLPPPPKKTRESVTPSWVGRVPQLKAGQYADGMPIHSPEYVCCKLILRPNKFHSRESFFDFGKVFKAVSYT